MSDSIVYLGLLVSGDKSEIEGFCIPVADRLEALGLNASEGNLFVHSPQRRNPAVLSFLTSNDLLLIAGCYIAGKFVDRAIEQIWDSTIWPAISGPLKDFENWKVRRKRYRIGVSVNYGDRKCSLIIVAVGGSAEDVEMQQRHFGKVLELFESQVPMVAEGACYRYSVENGEIRGPDVFVDHATALAGLTGMIQVGEVKTVR